MSGRSEASCKKPYEAPCLRVYGDITKVTRNSTGSAGMADNNPTRETT
jgi:hypothetical protein